MPTLEQWGLWGKELWGVYCEMTPYVALGLLLAGILHAFIKRSWVTNVLGNPKRSPWRAMLDATLIGVPLPVCSCGVIPMAAALKRSGASTPATVSFLISTPQTGIDSIIATYGILGPVFGTVRLIAAFVTGITGGAAALFFGKETDVSSRTDSEHLQDEVYTSFGQRLKAIFSYGFSEMLGSLSVPLFWGILAAGVLQIAMPENFLADYSPNVFVQMILVAVVSLPLYICSTAAVPVAALLMLKGLSPGAAFVLLTAGPVTNLAALFLIRSIFGTRQMFIFIGTVLVSSMAFGMGLNLFLEHYSPQSTQTLCHEHGPALWQITVALLFTLPFAFALFRRVKPLLIREKKHHCCHSET